MYFALPFGGKHRSLFEIFFFLVFLRGAEGRIVVVRKASMLPDVKTVLAEKVATSSSVSE